MKMIRCTFQILILALFAGAASAQTAWLPSGTGDFNTSSNWSAGTPALGVATSITNGTVGTPTVVNLASNQTGNTGDLTIGSNDTLNLNLNTNLFVDGSQVLNNGAINILGGSGTNTQFLVDNSNQVLQGTGVLTLSGASGGGTAYLDQATGGMKLTNESTIQGNGIIGNNGLSLVNQSGGTINANVTGQTLTLQGIGSTFANSSLIEATNGGILQINGNVLNNAGGNLTANGSGSTLQLYGSVTVQGGTLNAINGGTMGTVTNTSAYLDGSTVAGPINLNGTYTSDLNTNTYLLGTINNNGNIQVNGGAGTNSQLLVDSTNLTLQGGGTVTLSTAGGGGNAYIDQATGGLTLTNVNNTIQGAGIVGSNGLAIVNQAGGTVDANVTGQALTFQGTSGITNANLIEATNGGILQINGGTVNNAGGNLTANGPGSTLQLYGSTTVQGGTLNAINGGTMGTVANNSAYLDGSTVAGPINLNGNYTGALNTNTYLLGTINNNGNLQVNGGSGNNTQLLAYSGNVTLQGGGTVTLSTASGGGIAIIDEATGGTTLTNVNNTIQGAGLVGNNGLTVVNQAGGTFDANVTGQALTFQGTTSVTNANLIEATNGGIVQFNGGIVHNAAGNLTANGSGSALQLSGSVTIQGGTLNAIGGGTMGTVTSNSAFLDGSAGALTINGIYTSDINTNTHLLGTITNHGDIQLNGGAANNTQLWVDTPNLILQGGGTVTLNTAGGGGNALVVQASGGSTLTNVDNTIQGAGIIGDNGLAIVNQAGGTFDANAAGQAMLFQGTGGVTNSNLIEATNGGILQFNGGTVNNAGGNLTANGGSSALQLYGSTTVEGGTLHAINGGTMGTVSGNSATLDGNAVGAITLDGTYTSDLNTNTHLVGTINNLGNLQVDGGSGSNTQIWVDSATVKLQGGGTVTLSTASGGGTAYFNESAGGETLENVNNTIQGAGTIGNNGLSLLNDAGGTVLANAAGQTLLLNGPGSVTNNGTMQANAGSTLQLTSNLTNFSGNTLTGGTYVVNGDSTNTGTLQFNLPTNLGGEIVNNAAAIVLNGPNAHTQFLDSNGHDALASLASNSTAPSSLTVSGGYNFTTAGAFSNAGTIHAANGGTFTASNGITGPSGTVQIDSGGTVSVAGGSTSSTVGTLTQNGTLALGSNNVTISTAYNNANFGVGNSFNNHADVTGSGQILAAGNTALAISGSAVSGGTTTTPTLANFGNVHLGQSVTLNYSISNSGTTGPAVLGAIQTNVNGGNITDSRLSGTGVTAGNFGPLGLGQSTTPYSVTFTASSAGALAAGQTLHFASNFDNVPSPTLTLGGGAAYQLAQTNTLPTPVNLGNVHVGASLGTALNITNTAPDTGGFTETLGASVTGTTGGASTTGSITGLTHGTSSNAISVNLNTGTAGALSGSATVGYSSQAINGSGLGTTALGSQTVNVTGAAFNLASASLGTINFGNVLVGSSISQFLNVTNSAPAGAFSEGLDATLGSFSGTGAGLLTGSGSITNLAAGATSTNGLSVGLNTSAAGTVAATVQVNLASDGATTSGLGITALPSQSTSINGLISAIATVGNLASASAATPNPVNLGNVRIGAVSPTQALTVSNTLVGPGEGLNASIGTASPGLTATGSFTSLQGGNSNNSNLVVGMNTATAGLKNGTATITLASDGSFNSGVTTALPSQTVNVNGAVYQAAQASLLPTAVNLGTVRSGTVVNTALSIGNVAPLTGGYTETLGASFGATSAGLSGSGSLTGLAAGAPSSNALSVQYTAGAAGAYSGSAAVNFQTEAINGSGLGTLGIGSQSVGFSGTVNAIANGVLSSTGAFGFTSTGANSGTLNFGSLTLGGGTLQNAFDLLNNVTGPADLLTGTFDISNLTGTPFAFLGTSSFSLGDLQDSAFNISFDTNAATGFFTANFFINEASHNAFQSDLALPQYDLTLEGTVNPVGSTVPDSGATWLFLGAGLASLVAARRRILRTA